jgi:RND superfamily putative drug exporter
MPWQLWRRIVTRYPARVVAAWLALAAAVGFLAPDLTELAAEGQARLVPEDAESARAKQVLRRIWPEQWSESLAVIELHRASGLTAEDREHSGRLAERFTAPDRPPNVLRVEGPGSQPELAERLVSRDGTMQLLLVALSSSFVAPATHEAVAWLEARAAEVPPPAGLERRWTGDAVIGRAYMRDVQVSLDRAAIVTVFLLLGVLLWVYRSPLLAAVPLATIGVGLVISRGILAWMARAGWEISPLVELFLIVILFGCGTDFCLFLSWRFGEHWNASNPAGAMRQTLRAAFEPIATSAGTVIIGLSLMGTTRFKLFSSTGPSVALGLALTLVACLSLTPALLVLLATWRPRSFAHLTRPKGGIWDDIGRFVLRRPLAMWAATLLLLVPLAVLGARTRLLQDLLSELPPETPSVAAFRQIAEKFGPGAVAPLAVIVQSPTDLSNSEGLALIDDLSRLLTRQRRLTEVRSATQPLGSTEPLEPARLSERLKAINDGFTSMAEGAEQLSKGLVQGAAKIQTALQLKRLTGVDLTGSPEEARQTLMRGLGQASAAMLGRGAAANPPPPEHTPPDSTARQAQGEAKPADPREVLIGELARAADGAREIAEGARRAHQEVTDILGDPVGRRALDRLLITARTVREHPELRRSFAAYIAPDGHAARIELEQAERFFSTEAMLQVRDLRRRVGEFLGEQDEVPIQRVMITGANAESTDIWAVTQRDQMQTWIVVPLGVFLILLLALRDFWTCVNLVATMVLTYLFALGATHLVFVTWLGAEGLDWKVPLFLFVLLVAVGVDYNIFLMSRLLQEARALGLRAGINRAIAQTGGLITSCAAITACSFASFLTSPLASIRQLGFALVVGIAVDATLVRPVLVPCGHWLIHRGRQHWRTLRAKAPPIFAPHVHVAD